MKTFLKIQGVTMDEIEENGSGLSAIEILVPSKPSGFGTFPPVGVEADFFEVIELELDLEVFFHFI